jgi:hypothetical protein
MLIKFLKNLKKKKPVKTGYSPAGVDMGTEQCCSRGQQTVSWGGLRRVLKTDSLRAQI